MSLVKGYEDRMGSVVSDAAVLSVSAPVASVVQSSSIQLTATPHTDV